ncbi:hypothetical protein SK128_026090 [Halocaridina rubra]|uniref:Tudor domain-containing protein n=1 Tax=Halocaridina rubra TaxID=373956 RepID=A0AAN8WK86_HALRR
MASADGEIVFDISKKNELTHEEIWDDTILIQQYDEALARVQKKLGSKATESENSEITSHSESARDNKDPKKKKKKNKRKKCDWHVGDFCRARYVVDGQTYEARIVALHPERNKATVRYIGYNNEEAISLGSLLKSRGQDARVKQEELADGGQSEFSDVGSSAVESEMMSDTDGERSSKRQQLPKMPPSFPHMMPPPSFGMPGAQFNPPPHLPDLPPPPALAMDMSDNPQTSEALHTMLMSWYMTGYHTGYYQGLRQGDLQKQKKKQK